MSGNLNIPGNGSHLQGAPTPANSYVGGGMQAPAPASKPTVEDVDEESGEDDSAGVNPASLLAQVRFLLALVRVNAPCETARRELLGRKLLNAADGTMWREEGPTGVLGLDEVHCADTFPPRRTLLS